MSMSFGNGIYMYIIGQETEEQEFTNSRPGPAVSAVRVAVCCVGELRGRREVVYCWLNDVESEYGLNSGVKEESNG